MNLKHLYKLVQIVETSDGSHTLFVPEINEHYHSVYGAIQESEHVFIRNGFDQCADNQINIFEIGFGTGLNALLTALAAIKSNKEVLYTAIEKFPLEDNIIKALNYPSLTGKEGKMIFENIHSCPWEKPCNILTNFQLVKIREDILQKKPDGNFNLIYFDAFGPDKQPEIWSAFVFNRIAEVTVPGGILVTYSAKGEVKRNLESCGFRVSRIPGPPGKREMIRATKCSK